MPFTKDELVQYLTSKFPVRMGERLIGVELEFPLVTLRAEATPSDFIRDLFAFLRAHNFVVYHDSGTSAPVEAKGLPSGPFSGDVIGTDVGACTLEVALAPTRTLHAAMLRFQRIIKLLLPFLKKTSVHMLGYGIQPVTRPNHDLMSNKGRYIFFEKESTNNFVPQSDGVDLHVFTVTAASQCHIDVSREEALDAVNVLNLLAGLQIALCANSSVWGGSSIPSFKSTREVLWDLGWPTRKVQVGIPEPFPNYTAYVSHLLRFRPLMIKRGWEYLSIQGMDTFEHYITHDDRVTATCVNGEPRHAIPRLEDFLLHAGFAWHCARLAPSFGTVEARVCCAQPPNATLGPAALALGIIENLEQATSLAQRFSPSFWREVRQMAARDALQGVVRQMPITVLATEMLQIAEAGLHQRGNKEEVYLDPFHRRLRSGRVPADHARELVRHKGMVGFVREFSYHSYGQ